MTPAPLDPLLGKPELHRRVADSEYSGAVLPARASFISQRYGTKALEAVAAKVSDQARSYLLDKPSTFAWFRAEPLWELDRVILEDLFEGQVRDFREMGIHSANQDLGAFSKSLLWLTGNPAIVMTRLARAFGKYYRGATGDLEKIDKGLVRVSLQNFVCAYHICEHLVPGWVKRASALAGTHGAKISQTQCIHRDHACCVWEASWAV